MPWGTLINMNKAEKLEYAELLEEKIKRNQLTKPLRMYEGLYGWQRKFNRFYRET